MSTKPKRGRPKLPESDKRGEVLDVRVNEAEMARYETAATAAGQPVRTWLRAIADLASRGVDPSDASPLRAHARATSQDPSAVLRAAIREYLERRGVC